MNENKPVFLFLRQLIEEVEEGKKMVEERKNLGLTSKILGLL